MQVISIELKTKRYGRVPVEAESFCDEWRGSQRLLPQVLITLITNRTWTVPYSLRALVGPKVGSIMVSHPTFARPLILREKHFTRSGDHLQETENAIRAHLDKMVAERRKKIERLAEETAALQEALFDICREKAKAALAKPYPEAALAKHYAVDKTHRKYAFAVNEYSAPIFVVTATEEGGFCGFAMLQRTLSEWSQAN